MKKALIFLAVFVPMYLQAAFRSIPLEDIEADRIDIHGEKIFLQGSVKVICEIGVIRCDIADIFLGATSDKAAKRALSTIIMTGNVEVVLSDGSILQSDRGEIFCQKREALFYGRAQEKVVYTSFCTENDEKVPIVISGRRIIARLVEGDDGKTTLTDILGDGAVSVEYMGYEEDESK